MTNKKVTPPRISRKVLEMFLPPYTESCELGDAEEKFVHIAEVEGIKQARKWYARNVFLSLPGYIRQQIIWRLLMFKNYMKIAARNFLRYKSYSFINIAGLATGVTSFILILMWVQDELSYDRFHEKADSVYRVGARGIIGETYNNQTWTPAPLGPTLKNDFPEVLQMVRVYNIFNFMGRYEDKMFMEKRAVAVDSTFFDVFSFKLLKGDSKTALTEPLTMVVTEDAARRYFGDEDPMGKTMVVNTRANVRITGVVENFPRNSHFHFDALLSMSSIGLSTRGNWMSNSFKTYIVLQPEGDPGFLESKLQNVVSNSVYTNFSGMFSGDSYWEYFLQPVTDIHLRSDLTGELGSNGNIVNVYIFSFTAFFILIVACINFMNLTTARSAKRAREVGMRKVVGSTRKQIIIQFLTESLMMVFVALLVSLVIVFMALPDFNSIIQKDLRIAPFSNSGFFLQLFGIILFVGILSGSYPAFYLSSFRPIAVISGSLKKGMGNSSLRNGLVVFQFIVTITLFVGTMIISRQLDYFQNKNLGFNREKVVIIKNTVFLETMENVIAFRDEISKFPGIQAVSASSSLPGHDFNNIMLTPEGKQTVTLDLAEVEPEYIDLAQVEMKEGRFFSREFSTDSASIILNETAVNLIQWEDPVGKTIAGGEGTVLKVIGVVKDLHYNSLHEPIKPMAFLHYRSPLRLNENYISVRIATGDIAGILQTIGATWKEMSGGKPFEYSFLADDYASLYESEMRTGKVVLFFSILAIVIAALGLLGLSMYTAEQRTKEISVRKVLGAENTTIFMLLSKEFAKWVLLANCIAWPLAYWLMNEWLNNFAYRVSIGWTSFVMAGVLTLLIALLTISYQSLKASWANPVNALRQE